ncbi:hypothetical protein ACFQ1S_05445 [Kibdelosporangium lantanae]|uniref:Uncharacterized protein n=1 Tax=Kibdelosporangium lantanae TaxID=1497396 RepID=A0ABW3M336_9PSEU
MAANLRLIRSPVRTGDYVPGMNPVAIAVVVIAAFVMSSVYYVITGKARAELLGTDPQARPEPWKPLVELVRDQPSGSPGREAGA